MPIELPDLDEASEVEVMDFFFAKVLPPLHQSPARDRSPPASFPVPIGRRHVIDLSIGQSHDVVIKC